MSGNDISCISPKACLGVIEKLDLRNNRLTVLDKLMIKTDSPAFRLRYLDLSGNRIHQITAEALKGKEMLGSNLDLRDNNLTSLESFKPLLAGNSFIYERVQLSGNPITCGCELYWLRHGFASSKLSNVTCHSRSSMTSYLASTFPLDKCRTTASATDTKFTLCENYPEIELSDLTVIEQKGVANVTWVKHGHGLMTGYRVRYLPIDDVKMKSSILVHPKVEFVVLSDLWMDTIYKICVSAVLNSRRKSSEICTDIHILYSALLNNSLSNSTNIPAEDNNMD